MRYYDECVIITAQNVLTFVLFFVCTLKYSKSIFTPLQQNYVHTYMKNL